MSFGGEKRDRRGKVFVEMKKWFGELNMNTMLKVVAGKRYIRSVEGEDEEEMMICRGTMKRVGRELDSMFGKWLEEHRRKRSSNNAIESLIVGGADTTTVMLTWTLSLLLNNRYARIKAQEEVETQVGKDRQLHRDPKIWPDPYEFRAESFLTPDQKGLDVMVMDFELIPFGAERRSCPGIGLADHMLHMVLATLLQNFDMSTPNGEPVDMTMIAGLTNAKASPLQVVLSPRLHATIDA
ncbi:hypothetical protein L1987_48375 [Smallanthus sonchifolius]|uniref:Uncharacterized protein n=1 Tax=Smallanthus sonchifolius TaxID=185202 RepID=A0ACB9FRR9_9ASTR|nr:hypothetical protein L1987_48375 [Smallanthus sonchifolius]